MWQHYRKTLLPTQLFIFGVCAALYWYSKPPLPTLLFLFLTMQLASILGAWWGARLRAKMRRREQALPLERRL